MIKSMRAVLLAAALLSLGVPAFAQSTVFIVRHAERADQGKPATMMADDPDLSAAGRRRADALAAVLKDAGIAEVFATEVKRTQQTAEPLARARQIKVQTVPAAETAALIEKLKVLKGNALVVSHSNRIPEILKGLGLTAAVQIAESEYDNLFVVVRSPTPVLIRLHYPHRM